ncbi:exodeoxyribonuclease VII small subunit [Clostridium sp. chh4-2]|uniref:exodeoxyribonuclease VII small subunit n=1 Tax=Clostridium sp. chh4-2 TaxID=2067550 RepID=UPI000CCE77B4|nr:exodeoxyribonuclease VII small subunit [Clostridium sp. chh4-2]PNV61225.1 exodeoxyribonuclease VII small subunit [Clostridium sp. chh4-2]
MAEKNKATGEEINIEQTFEALEELIGKMEAGETTLEESFKYYETGMKLVKSCNDQIDKVEKQIMILAEGEQER